MSDDEFAERGVYSVFIEAPVEAVWSELIDTTKPRPFFFNARLETNAVREGSTYRMVSKDNRHVAVFGEILELDPPHRLVQSFRFTNLDDTPCTVTYTLEPQNGGTLFTLATDKVPAGTKTEKSMAQGGEFITSNLKAWVETGRPTFSGRLILAMIGLMGPFSPKSTRIEHWPLN